MPLEVTFAQPINHASITRGITQGALGDVADTIGPCGLLGGRMKTTIEFANDPGEVLQLTDGRRRGRGVERITLRRAQRSDRIRLALRRLGGIASGGHLTRPRLLGLLTQFEDTLQAKAKSHGVLRVADAIVPPSCVSAVKVSPYSVTSVGDCCRKSSAVGRYVSAASAYGSLPRW